MTRICSIILCLAFCVRLSAQELYIYTEPASNMPTRSMGARLTNKLMPMQHHDDYSYRVEPEVMIGVNKKLMLHAAVYASNMFQKKLRFEGGSAYAKYRFLSLDDVHSHFRMAAFGKISLINNPPVITTRVQHTTGDGTVHEEKMQWYSDELDLDGNHSGWSGGLIATQLIHKLAVSGTASYANRWKNIGHEKVAGINNNAVNYSLSAGYLLLPRHYKNYDQVNVNLYLELLGSTGMDTRGHYIDAAPGIQFIFNSISRLDIGWRKQLTGNMTRFNTSSWLLRYEYNFLNLFNRKGV